MLDWKIMAASLAALVFVSSVFVGDFGIRDFFGTLTERLGEWLGNSPFGGLFTAPTTSIINADTVSLKIYPDTFLLKPDHSVNVTFGRREIADFMGEIEVDYVRKRITLDEANSHLILTMPLEQTTFTGVMLKKFVVDKERIDVSTGDWEISSHNGTIELYDFQGTVEIDSRSVSFSGNITRLVRL
jgi:hypothetical protein